jgi:hypothetical protein
LGAYGTSVITALTAQNTRGVTGVHVVPTEFVIQQLETLVADVRLDVIKIGMLANADIVRSIADFLRRHPQEHVVLDPVMVATSGDRLLDDDAVQAVRELMPLTSLITPNSLRRQPCAPSENHGSRQRSMPSAGSQRRWPRPMCSRSATTRARATDPFTTSTRSGAADVVLAGRGGTSGSGDGRADARRVGDGLAL